MEQKTGQPRKWPQHEKNKQNHECPREHATVSKELAMAFTGACVPTKFALDNAMRNEKILNLHTCN